jgi:hypothetical protein
VRDVVVLIIKYFSETTTSNVFFLTTSTGGIAPHLILLIYSIGNQITKMFTSVEKEIAFLG